MVPRRRRGFAASLSSIVIFSTLLVAGLSMYTSQSTYFGLDASTSIQNQEVVMMSSLMSQGVTDALIHVESAVVTDPPVSCLAAVSSSYVTSLAGKSQVSGDFDNQDVNFSISSAWSYASSGPAADNASSYGGWLNTSAGAMDFKVSVHVVETGPEQGLPSYTDTQEHYFHLFLGPSCLPESPVVGNSTLGIIVPLYAFPGAEWSQLASEKLLYPNVSVLAVINPGSGPGFEQDPSFVAGIQTLEQAGIVVAGYTDTAGGSIPLPIVEADIMDYAAWYHLTTIFLDDFATIPGSESYYATITAFAHSVGISYVLGNPGTLTSTTYRGTTDGLVLWESLSLPPAGWSFIQGSAVIASSTPLPGQSWFSSLASQGVRWVYASDEGNSYMQLPSYLDQEFIEVNAA